MTSVEIYIIVDSDGNSAIGTDESGATEAYEADIGELIAVSGFRTVKITVNVPEPEVIELPAPIAGKAP